MGKILLVCLLLCANYANANLTKVQFVQLAEKHNSISSFINTLVKKYPEFMSQYVAVTNSKSLQASSIQFPRIITFGKDASFVFSFNGDPKDRGYQSIEFMSFDSENNRFAFQRIVFPEDLQKRKEAAQDQTLSALEKEELTWVLTKPRVSEVNPPVCLTCHTPMARPIWEPYPSWPRTFAPLANKIIPIASENLKTFSKGLADKERYNVIPNLIEKANSVDQEYFSVMNKKFNTLTQKNNFRRMIQSWTEHPEFNKFFPEISNVATCPDSHNSFTRAGFPSTTNWSEAQAVWEDSERRAISAEDTLNQLSYGEPIDLTFRIAHGSDLFWRLRYVVENRMKLSMYADATSLARGTYLFTTPGYSNFEFLDTFRELMAKRNLTVDLNCRVN